MFDIRIVTEHSKSEQIKPYMVDRYIGAREGAEKSLTNIVDAV